MRGIGVSFISRNAPKGVVGLTCRETGDRYAIHPNVTGGFAVMREQLVIAHRLNRFHALTVIEQDARLCLKSSRHFYSERILKPA